MLLSIYYSLILNLGLSRLDPSFSVHTTPVGYVNTNTYGREHVYEMQLCESCALVRYIHFNGNPPSSVRFHQHPCTVTKLVAERRR